MRVSEVAADWIENARLVSEYRAAALWFWSLDGGGRIGATCNLTLAEFERGRLFADDNGVYQFNSFSKGSEAILEVTQRTIDATDGWLSVRPESDRAELFTTIFNARYPIGALKTEVACHGFQQLSEAAELDYTITSHMLRHRMGTLLTERFDPKVAAMKLGHADAHTTAQTAIAYYYRPSRSKVSIATAAMVGA